MSKKKKKDQHYLKTSGSSWAKQNKTKKKTPFSRTLLSLFDLFRGKRSHFYLNLRVGTVSTDNIQVTLLWKSQNITLRSCCSPWLVWNSIYLNLYHILKSAAAQGLSYQQWLLWFSCIGAALFTLLWVTQQQLSLFSRKQRGSRRRQRTFSQ